MTEQPITAPAEQSPQETELETLGNMIVKLVDPGQEPRTYSVEAELTDESKVVLACKINDDPTESEMIVSQYSIGKKGLRRQAYRWSRAFPDSAERQFIENIDPEAETVRTNKKGFSPDDKAKIASAIYLAQEVLESND